jgi:hypothetical protein
MMRFPEHLHVSVTSRHIATAKKRQSPLEIAVRDLLRYEKVIMDDSSIRVFRSSLVSHDARYWIPDDAWKHRERWRAGKKVKPAVFVLPAVYLKEFSHW